MKTDYILGIEFSKCDKDTERLCLYKKQYGNCKNGIKQCHYPLLVNPLCTCKSKDKCYHKYSIVNYEDKTYILYFCKGCNYLVNDVESAIEKIIKPMKSSKIYFGKDLEKLCKKILKKSDKKVKSDIELTIEFLENAFSSLNRRA